MAIDIDFFKKIQSLQIYYNQNLIPVNLDQKIEAPVIIEQIVQAPEIIAKP